MSSEYNIKGKADVISEIVSRTMKEITATDPCCNHSKNKRLVSEEFPSDPGEKDINVVLEQEHEDAFLELCEAYGIEAELV